MKILIAFYSKTGHTRRVAEDLAKELSVDLDEIKDLKNRSGFLGWLLGGRDAMKKNLTDISVQKNPKDYDLVVIGTPIWGWNLTPAVRTYVHRNKFQIKKIAYFQTSDNTPLVKPLEYFEQIMEKKTVAAMEWRSGDLKNLKKYQEKLSEFIYKIKS